MYFGVGGVQSEEILPGLSASRSLPPSVNFSGPGSVLFSIRLAHAPKNLVLSVQSKCVLYKLLAHFCIYPSKSTFSQANPNISNSILTVCHLFSVTRVHSGGFVVTSISWLSVWRFCAGECLVCVLKLSGRLRCFPIVNQTCLIKENCYHWRWWLASPFAYYHTVLSHVKIFPFVVQGYYHKWPLMR